MGGDVARNRVYKLLVFLHHIIHYLFAALKKQFGFDLLHFFEVLFLLGCIAILLFCLHCGPPTI